MGNSGAGYRSAGLLLLATVLLVAGCGTPPARSQPLPAAGRVPVPGRVPAPAASSRPPRPPPGVSQSQAASRSPATAPIWLDSLQMTSAGTGWALRWTQSPAMANGGYLGPARTADGARTWISVIPPAARALLATPGAAVVLQALDGERAWLAVTAAATDGSPTHLTEVFGTVNGGRTWTRSAPLMVSGYAVLLSFAGPEHGWLLMADGVAMGQEPVQLYRTATRDFAGPSSPRPRRQGPKAAACQPAATRRPWRSLPRPSATQAMLVTSRPAHSWSAATAVWTGRRSRCRSRPPPAATAVRYPDRSSSAKPGSWSSTGRRRRRISWSARISG